VDGRAHFTEIALVGLVPACLAGVLVTQAQELCFELLTRAPEIIHGIRACAAQVPQGFVVRMGHVDASQFSGPVKPREHECIAAVVLTLVAGALRSEGRGDNLAIDSKLT
jgi:hypothetical protein